MEFVRIQRAIISVSDKTGIVEFARALARWNVEFISTGGTLDVLREAGIPARPISEITGFPEILDGRVKTLHPNVHAALLAVSDNPTHREQLRSHGITPIDMVVVNLYPFEQTVGRGNVPLEYAIEQIDIGGPTMLRAAAKNYLHKAVVVDPGIYQAIIEEMERNNGALSEKTRFDLAQQVFLHTSRYDAVIADYLTKSDGRGLTANLPEVLSISLPKVASLRYGENPHQQAALYGGFYSYFQKLHGKDLSYNNIVDIQAAAELVEEFPEPTIVIIKHTNPCGVGSAATLTEAYLKALATDPKAAFGGIVAMNRPLDLAAARKIDEIFTEVIIAPDYSGETLEFLKRKKDRRLIRQRRPAASDERPTIRNVVGGVLLQTRDDVDVATQDLRVVTKRSPTPDEHTALLFGWRVAKHVKSNAIVYALADRTIGIGAGQMSRFDASRIAVQKAYDAGLDLKGTAVASDAFFPFADGLIEAARAGATAVIQPGGSIRDQEVIQAADENNIAMVFTGIRHFRH